MRPPRANPLFVALIAAALALEAAAQVRTNAGADAAAGTSGAAGASLNAGGVAPIGLTGASLSPLQSASLSPALAAPAVSLDRALGPSALQAASPAAAAAAKPPAQAASSPPGTPPKEGPAAAPAGPPAGPPYFIQSLAKLGVPTSLTSRLAAFLAARHPGDQDKIYHGLGHSHEVADLAARVLDGQSLPAEKKILLILSAALHDVDPDRAANTPARVAATIGHLDSDDEARGLLLDFGGRYAFTSAQVKALIMATDFSPDPGQMQAKHDAFAEAAGVAFPGEPEWALTWGKRLAFADQASTYVGSLAGARKRVEGLAVELRAQLESIGKGPGPSNEALLAGTFKFLNALKQNPLFALLPAEQRASFDAVSVYFEARQTPEAWSASFAPAPARAPPVSPDVASARRYIQGIFSGSRAPTERETDSLLGDWLEEKGIPPGSPRASAVRAALAPGKARAEADVAAKLDPLLRRHAALLIRVAARNRATVPYVESIVVKRGLLQYIGELSDASLENQIEMALTNAELERAVAAYPDNDQGELMRSVAGAMGARSGKSVEEVARDGVFLYADFNGASFLRGFASRDPDIQRHTIAFYVTRKDGKWRVDGYRQKAHGNTSDLRYIEGLKSWLRAGGIPSSDFQ